MSTSLSAWQVVSNLAQVAHSPTPDLATLAQVVAAECAAQPSLAEGALIQIAPTPRVLAAWGIADSVAEALVPATQCDSSAVCLPAGWRSVKVGGAAFHGVLAVQLPVDEPLDDLLTILGAQISLLWQATIAHEQQHALQQLDVVLAQCSRATSLDELRAVLSEHAGPASAWTIFVAQVTDAVARLWTPLVQALPADDPVIASAHTEPAVQPFPSVDWLPAQPYLSLAVGEQGVVVVSSQYVLLPELHVHAVVLARTIATKLERLWIDQAMQRREQAITALATTFHQLTVSVNSDVFLQTLVVQSSQLVGASGGALFVYDHPSSKLELQTVHQLPADRLGTLVASGDGLIGTVAQTQRTMAGTRAQVRALSTLFGGTDQLAAAVAAPLHEGELLGGVLVLVQHAGRAPFTAADTELLDSFASQASLVLRTAHLFEAQRRQARELFVLYENSRTAGSSLDINHILGRLTEHVVLALEVDQALVLMWHPDTNSVELMAAVVDDAIAASMPNPQLGTRWTPVPHTVAHTIITSKQPFTSSTVGHDQRITIAADALLNDGVRSVLGVPLLMQDQLIGVLMAANYTINRTYTPSEVNLAQTLASQAAVAVRNARLLTNEQRRAAELSMLQEVGQHLNASLELPDVLAAVQRGIERLLPNNELEICVFNPQTQLLHTVYTTEIASRYASRSGTYTIGESFTGWMARHHTSLRIDDIHNDPRVAHINSRLQDANFHSYLGVPLLVGDEFVGTLELGSGQAHHFTADDERVLTIMAVQTAHAIRNVQRYEATDEVLRERVRELTALQHISRELTATLHLEKLLPAMLSEILQATNHAHGAVCLWSEDSGQFQLVTAQGYADQAVMHPALLNLLTTDSVVQTLQQLRPVMLDDVEQAQWSHNLAPIRSLLLTPILYEHRVAGVIIVSDVRPHAFDKSGLDFVQAVADQAALAIGNAQHFAEQVRQRDLLQQRAGLLNQVLEIGNALRADMELSVLLEEIAFSISEAAGFRTVVFSLVDPDQPDLLRVVTAAGLALTDLEQRRANPQQVTSVYQDLIPQHRVGHTFFIADAEADSDSTTWQPNDRLLMPLYSTERELMGTLTVEEPFSRQRPTRRVVETLEIFANQAAIAIENARLFNQRTRQIAELRVVNRISRAATSSLDINALARDVYDVLREVLPVDACYLVVFDQAHNTVVASWMIDQGTEYIDVMSGPLVEASLTGWIIQHSEALIFTDLPQQLNDYEGMNSHSVGDDVPRSWLGVPLLSGDGVVRGVLSVQHYAPSMYAQRDADLLSTVANQLAVAVENARLFRDARQRLEQLALLNRIGRLTNSTLNPIDVLQEVYQALKGVLPLDVFYSFVYDSEQQEIVLRVNVEQDQFYIEQQRENLLPRSPSEWIIKHQEPLLFNDMPQEIKRRFRVKRFGDPHHRVRSWIGVPLRVSDEVSVGLLSVQHYAPNMYTERDVSLLQTVASQVALAIQNARLFVDRERQIQELNAIEQIGQVMSASFDLDEMLRQTAYHLQWVTKAPVFFTQVYDPDAHIVLRAFAIQEDAVADSPVQGHAPRPDSLSGWVLEHRMPLLIDDLSDTEKLAKQNLVPQRYPVANQSARPRSWVGVPVLARDGAPIGMLSLQAYEPGFFDQRSVMLLSNVASHVSLGLQKVQLFQERDRQIRELEAIRQIGQVTSSTLDMNELMQGVHRVLTSFLPVDSFLLNIYDTQRDMLVDNLIIDLDERIEPPKLRPVPPHSLTDWILNHQQPLLFRDLETESAKYPTIQRATIGSGATAKSWVGVPLVARNDQSVGVLALQHYQPAMFDDRDMQFLMNVAYQVTLGIQNVRLYQQTEHSLQQVATEAERMSLISHVSEQTASTLDVQVLYDLAVEEMVHATGAEQARLLIFDHPNNLALTRAEYPPQDMTISMPIAGTPSIEWLLAYKRPLNINDIHTDPMVAPIREVLQQVDAESLLIIPLIVKGEVIGSVGLHGHSGKAFDARDEETCQTIANQISQALENARLFAETQRQAKALSEKVGELSALLEAGQALSSIHDPEEVLDTLVRLVGRQLDVDTVLLSTVSAEDTLIAAASIGLPADFIEQFRGQFDQGLVGSVAQSRTPLVVQDVADDTPQSMYPEFNQAFGLRSFLGVPILYRDEVLGVLSVMTQQVRLFQPDEIALLSALADQSAIALENARLFAERERQITMLGTINFVTQDMASTLDQEGLLRQLHWRMGLVVDTRWSFIALYEAAQQQLVFPIITSDGASVTWPPVPLAEGVLSQVVRERRTVVLHTAAEAAGASRLVLEADPPIQSWVGVPIVSGDTVLGVINIQNPQPRMFAPETVQFLQSVASQAAIALENARLFNERERQIAQAETLASIGQAIAAARTPDELLQAVLERLNRVVDTANAYIALYDARSNIVSATVGNQHAEPFVRSAHVLTDGFLKTVLIEQEPLLLTSRQQVEAHNFNPSRANSATSDLNVQSVLVAPITMASQMAGSGGTQPLGVVVVQSEQPDAFDHLQLQLLITVANQTSSAVQKALLFSEYERRIRELDTLNRISQSVTSTISLDEILQRLYEGINAVVDASTSFIGLYNSATNVLTYSLAYDRGEPVELVPQTLGVNVNSWVIEHRQPLLLNTAEEADQYRDELSREISLKLRVGTTEDTEQSYLIVPIVAGPNVLGIINIQSYEPYAFSEYDLSFISTVAGQAAASLANARLFESREHSIRQLHTLNQIGQALGSTVRVEDLLHIIYEQTSLLLHTDNFYIALYDERNQEVNFPLFYEHGIAQRIPPQRAAKGLTEYIITQRQPLVLYGNIEQQLKHYDITARGALPYAWLGVPMIAADKVIGVLSLQRYDIDLPYSEDDIQLLSTIASQSAQALENARLFTESRESVRELSTLSETSVSLAGTLDLEELLAISASTALEMARSDFGGVFLIDPEGTTVVNSLVLNRDREELPLPLGATVRLSDLATLGPLRRGEMVQVYDAPKVADLAAFVEPLHIRGALFLPMMQEGLRGVLFVGMDTPWTFEDRSIASLYILTTQVGQALQNAQLFKRISQFNQELERTVNQRTQALAEANTQLTGEKERVEALYSIVTELGTTLDRNELLIKTLELAAQALNVSRGSVMLIDRESKILTCQAVLNEELGLRALDVPIDLEPGEGLANWVLGQGEGVIINDTTNDPRWAHIGGRGDDVRSVIAVPLLSSDMPQGVLMLNNTEPNFFTADHLRFLSTIGSEVSSALHNADLYTLVYDSADRLSEAMWQQREDTSKTTAILQSVSEGVIVLDHDTKHIILYNPAAERVLRIPSSEVFGRELETFAETRNEAEYHEEGRALLLYSGLREGIEIVNRTESVHTSILELPGQVIAANFAPVLGELNARFGVVVVLRDITREIEADRAKRDFIATVSHELRTPLTPIRGFVDLLLLGAIGALTTTQRQALETVKSNTMRMLSLVEDLLEIGRLEAGKIVLNTTQSDLNQLVRDIINMWNLELERKAMTLHLELDDTLPLIEYDAKRVGQVLTNLVSNAIKYTYEQGSITIRTWQPEAGMVQVDVTDTGVGLKLEDQHKMFSRFFRADSPLRDEVGGTGLGLSIAKSFIELHHGDMWVESVYGEGSTFSFSFPVRQPRPDLGDSDSFVDVVTSELTQPLEEATS